MMSRRATALVMTSILAVTLSVAGCSSSTSNVNEGVGNAQPAVPPVIIDVRTPEEYAEGHLQGAVNFNVESDEFETQISLLDKNSTYQVYCRSGNRSATAVRQMEDLGFLHVTDLGGLDEASQATGKTVIS
jgi:rhodanese-related sulfurtransferase